MVRGSRTVIDYRPYCFEQVRDLWISECVNNVVPMFAKVVSIQFDVLFDAFFSEECLVSLPVVAHLKFFDVPDFFFELVALVTIFLEPLNGFSVSLTFRGFHLVMSIDRVGLVIVFWMRNVLSFSLKQELNWMSRCPPVLSVYAIQKLFKPKRGFCFCHKFLSSERNSARIFTNSAVNLTIFSNSVNCIHPNH